MEGWPRKRPKYAPNPYQSLSRLAAAKLVEERAPRTEPIPYFNFRVMLYQVFLSPGLPGRPLHHHQDQDHRCGPRGLAAPGGYKCHGHHPKGVQASTWPGLLVIYWLLCPRTAFFSSFKATSVLPSWVLKSHLAYNWKALDDSHCSEGDNSSQGWRPEACGDGHWGLRHRLWMGVGVRPVLTFPSILNPTICSKIGRSQFISAKTSDSTISICHWK